MANTVTQIFGVNRYTSDSRNERHDKRCALLASVLTKGSSSGQKASERSGQASILYDLYLPLPHVPSSATNALSACLDVLWLRLSK